jgi:NAD(P)-dependent dehydrogenase (short-subunit alcohol dehydrogenase family)
MSALVLGASSGIGRAVAASLAARGVVVGAVGRTADALHRLAEDVRATPGQVVPLPCDVTDRDRYRELFGAFVAEHGDLRTVVHSVGDPYQLGPLWTLSIDAAEKTVAALVTSVIHTVGLAVPVMAANGGGNLAVISSGAASKTTEAANRALYSGSKAAVDQLVRVVGCETASTAPGVGVLSIYPGVVDTPLQRRKRAVEGELGQPPMVSAAEVGAAIADLLERPPAALNGRIWMLRKGAWLERT